MTASGLRSRASIAKALKELDALGAIDYRVRRGSGGEVAGLWFQFLGLPTETPEQARVAYRAAASKEFSALVTRMHMLEDEIKALERGDESDG